VLRTFCGQGVGGSSDADIRIFGAIGAKNFGFFEINGVSERTRRGGASAYILRTRGKRDEFFAILCGRLLCIVLY